MDQALSGQSPRGGGDPLTCCREVHARDDNVPGVRRVAYLWLLVAVAIALAAPAGAGARARGEVQVLALIPPPGFPAMPLVVGDRIYEGTYANPSGSSAPSRVLEYSTGGELLRSWTVAGQVVSQTHGIQVAAYDSKGNLILLDDTSGRVIRLDPRTGAQTPYSRVADLPNCSSAPAGAPCSQTTLDLTPEPDYAAWGPDGSLYITDYQQAVIWKIPPGGGKATIWLSSRLLDGGPFGTACLLMMPDHHTLLFDQASHGGLGGSNPTTGNVYEVPIETGGRPGAIKDVWESGPADAPDGCMLAQSGDIYIAMSGFSNQIVEISAAGQQIAAFGQPYTGANGSSIPFDTPSGMDWVGTSLIIANQSYIAQNTANMALLSLETGETGMALYVPPGAGYPASAKPHKRHQHRHPRRTRHRRCHDHRDHDCDREPDAPGGH